ncbi:unnamed protein product [Blepharisma stoltei]|uniref:TLC domain-containing protein n=1 Tax=Blepharisma stoltei TaxID=1481888 RepID=A0AAU9JPL6_9CILI|nr:unnamed protein product [Blepharisma stoltei]
MIDYVSTLFISIAFWTFLFFLFSQLVEADLPTRQLWDFRNRLVTFIHGVFYLTFTTITVINEAKLGSDNTYFQIKIILWMLGYHIYDTICKIKFGISDNFIVIHHSLVIIGSICGLSSNNGIVEILYGSFIGVLPNPSLQIKEILRYNNQRDTKIYLLAELTYIFTFIFARFIIGPVIIYEVVTSWSVFWPVRAIAFSLEILSFYWISTFYNILKKRYQEYQHRVKEGKSLPWIFK